MTPLRIQCETCQATLRVRDEGFIGQVHACPRCGGMVMIAETSASAADLEGGTAEVSGAEGGAIEGGPITLGLSSTLEETPSELGEATPDTPQLSTPEHADAAVAAAGPTIARHAPLATTAVTLMATGAVVAIWAVGGARAPATDGPTVGNPPTAVAEASTPDEPQSEGTASKAPNDPAAAIASTEPTPVTSPALDTSPDEPTARVAALPTEPAEPSDLEPANDSEPESPVDEPWLAEAPSAVVAPEEIDPLAFDITQAELVLRRVDPGEATPRAPIDSTDDSPAASADDAAPVSPAKSLDQRLAAVARDGGVYVARTVQDTPSPPFAESAAVGLSHVVPRVALRDVPLADAVRLLGRVAGVGITIDPAALRHAGVVSTTPIDIEGEQRSVGELLAAALRPHRLALEIDTAANGPVARLIRIGAQQRRAKAHEVGDLLSAGDPGWLALVTPHTSSNAATTNAASASGELALDGPLAEHYDAMIACERLRRARGLPQRSRYPASRLATTPALAELDATLNRRTTFSFVEPTPLGDVFDHWRRVTRRELLVDWASLGEVGLGPASRVECSVINRPWRDALDGVLDRLGLDWAAIDGRTLLVASAERIADHRTLELYPLPPTDGTHRVATLRSTGVDAHYDLPARTLLVRASAPTHRALWAELGNTGG